MRSKVFRYLLPLFVLALGLQSCTMPTPTPEIGDPPMLPADLYVAIGGDDANDCLSMATACLTVQGAMRKALPYGTIIIGPGTFYAPGVAFMPLFDLNFVGAGVDATTLVSNRVTTIFRVTDPVRVVIRDLTIGHGAESTSRSGEGLDARNASAVVTLENCRVRDHPTGVSVWAGATVHIRNCRIEHNQTGIANSGNLTVDDTVITQNASEYGTAFRNNASARLSRTQIVRNGVFDTTSGAGTAAVINTGELIMENVEVSDNISYGLILQGGAITFSGGAASNNGGTGIWHVQGNFTGQSLIVRGNGGFGVLLGGRSDITSVGTLRLRQSAIIGNYSAGLRVDAGEAHLQNVTVSGNVATSSGGGGIWMYGGDLFLLDSTVAYNTGHGLHASGGGGVITARRSIVALNSDLECNLDPRYTVSLGPGGFVCYDTWTPATLKLDPLTEEAGTFVHPLQADSPAVDGGGPVSGCPAIDQRGYRRPAGSTCDAGAYEFGTTSAAIVIATPEETDLVEILPLVTDTPSAFPVFTFAQNANCRKGPGTPYEVVTTANAGQQAAVEGRSQTPDWYYVLLPNGGPRCWVAATTGTLSGSVDGLPVIPAPLLPTATFTVQPSKPAAPELNVSNQVCDASQYVVRLSWKDVAGETGYRVYRDGALIATLGANVTVYDDLSPDYNAHDYRVEAYNGAGASGSAVLKSEGCLY